MAFPIRRNQTHYLVTVNYFAFFVANNDAVSIPVERNTDISFLLQYSFPQEGSIGRAAPLIDIHAIRVDTNRDDICTQFPKRRWRNFIGRAMRTIDNYFHATKIPPPGECSLCKFYITRLSVINPLGPSKPIGWRNMLPNAIIHKAFYFCFNLIRQLIPIRPKQFNPIIFKFIMRGRNHNPNICA